MGVKHKDSCADDIYHKDFSGGEFKSNQLTVMSNTIDEGSRRLDELLAAQAAMVSNTVDAQTAEVGKLVTKFSEQQQLQLDVFDKYMESRLAAMERKGGQ